MNMSSLKSQSTTPALAGIKGDVASIDLGKYRLGALLGKGAFGQVRTKIAHNQGCTNIFIFRIVTLFVCNCAGVQGFEHRKWRSRCSQASAPQCHQRRAVGRYALEFLLRHENLWIWYLLASNLFLSGIMGEIALLKRLKSSRITRYMDSIKTKVRVLRFTDLLNLWGSFLLTLKSLL